MQIGIISDTHDNWPTLDRVCRFMADRGIGTLIHCGDVCAPLTLGHLLDQYEGEVHLAFGNVDGDPFLMAARFGDRPNLHLHGAERAELELGESPGRGAALPRPGAGARPHRGVRCRVLRA